MVAAASVGGGVEAVMTWAGAAACLALSALTSATAA